MNPGADPDEGYAGAATLRLADGDLPVRIRVSGRFEPIDGRYRWTGAADGGDDLVARVRAGTREGTLRIPDAAEAPVRLGEPDPWGAVRITGVGHPPWVPELSGGVRGDKPPPQGR